MARIVAAMSGGVDSSVAAALLAREARTGDEVIGVWMRLHPDGGEGYEQSRCCCSPDAPDDARRVAQIVGIPFFVLNLERSFGERVIDAFADGYLAGATPNPCQACNQYIKFDELLRRGLAAYGADRWRPAITRGSRSATGAASCCAPRMPTRTRPTSCGSSTRASCATPASRWAS